MCIFAAHMQVNLKRLAKPQSSLNRVCVQDMPFTAVTLLSPLRSVKTSMHRTMMQMGRSTGPIERSMHRGGGAPSRNTNRRLNAGVGLSKVSGVTWPELGTRRGFTHSSLLQNVNTDLGPGPIKELFIGPFSLHGCQSCSLT